MERRISGFEDDIALVTLAPELPGAEAVIAALRQRGVVVSLGHSAADERAARRPISRAWDDHPLL